MYDENTGGQTKKRKVQDFRVFFAKSRFSQKTSFSALLGHFGLTLFRRNFRKWTVFGVLPMLFLKKSAFRFRKNASPGGYSIS